MNRQLLNKKTRVSSIPALKNDANEWIADDITKANLFAKIWNQKCELPSERDIPYVGGPECEHHIFVPIRARDVVKELQRLDVSKVTGPDKISAFILRRLAQVLAIPIAILCRRILFEACWPEQWKLHHLVPIFKCGAAFLAKKLQRSASDMCYCKNC